MPDHTDALQKLTEILERALDAGASSVALEFDRGELEIYLRFGNTGVGEVLPDRELADALFECIRKQSRSRGRMSLTLHGQKHSIQVRRYENFEEPAYELRFGQARGASGRSRKG